MKVRMTRQDIMENIGGQAGPMTRTVDVSEEDMESLKAICPEATIRPDIQRSEATPLRTGESCHATHGDCFGG